ncbi:MAG: DUF443 family protein [Lachnospiraceae bacterium]|jgi:uncharacterized membrane protein (TIGR01218 family)|nr:DUF443 family protein [Lachnospiraceae bacterium]
MNEYIIYNKINLRYSVIKKNGQYYLVDYSSPRRFATFYSAAWPFSKITGYKISKEQFSSCNVKVRKNYSFFTAFGIGMGLSIFLRFIDIPNYITKGSLINRLIITMIILLGFFYYVNTLRKTQAPIELYNLDKVSISYKFSNKVRPLLVFIVITVYVLAFTFGIIYFLFLEKQISLSFLICFVLMDFMIMIANMNFVKNTEIEIKELI